MRIVILGAAITSIYRLNSEDILANKYHSIASYKYQFIVDSCKAQTHASCTVGFIGLIFLFDD